MGASERAGAAGQGGFGARAIVAEKDVVLAKLPAGIDPARLAEAMGPARIAFKDLSIGPGGGTAVVPLLNVPDWSGARRALLSSAPGVELVEGVCTVGVVGDGLASSAEPIARFFAALRAAGAEPIATTAGPLRLGAVVRADTGEAAQRALHAAFVS
jgi:aspartate kinase